MTVHESGGQQARQLAAFLNENCFDVALAQDALRSAMGDGPGTSALYRAITDERPHLLSKVPYFISGFDANRMADVVRAIDSVVALPAYREHVLGRSPQIAKFDPGPLGMFFGYDFHLHEDGPRLIEINTNAGGALLNTLLARALHASIPGESRATGWLADSIESAFLDMFRDEWRKQRGDVPLTSVAVVDIDPQGQYLYPEFRLFERLLERNGIAAVVASPADFAAEKNGLWVHDRKIDLVYNRLTDFSLGQPENAVLANAYLDGLVVLTPHPRVHALYADKRNLALFTDSEWLDAWGVPDWTQHILRTGIPRTIEITDSNAEEVGAERNRYFFKPASGYGGKAVYRGDKITRRVWQHIASADYVAQAHVPAGVRRTALEGNPLKVDVRAYVYDGRIQLFAARMYQGQTTNFRTAGGGFATVLRVDDGHRYCPFDPAQ